MAREFDISMLGRRDLERKLRRLASSEQRRVIRAALVQSARRTKGRVLENLSGDPVGRGKRDPGLRAAFAGESVKSVPIRGGVRVGIDMPTRSELGIEKNDPGFYPAAVEYGHPRAPAHPYIRPAIDNHFDGEITEIARDIGAGIERIAKT